MPLVVMCGLPGSGKTEKAQKIKEYLEKEHGKQVMIVSEAIEAERAGFTKETLFSQPQQEKHLRSVLKSEAMKLLSKDNVVILDSGNYIKGYRYELYCGSKAVKSTQCTVYCLRPLPEARGASSLPPHIFTELLNRFEEPNGSHRWDSPLVVWGVEGEELGPLDLIHQALHHSAAPTPNLSTQNAPVSDTRFLQQLDEVTRRVCDHVGQGQVEELLCDSPPTPPQLARLRRQFLVYAKMNLSNTPPQEVARLFTQYLITSLNT